MSVGAVVVTYESGEVLPHLLGSLKEWEPRVPVVVVDSGSPPGPPDAGAVELVAMKENVGFGRACNTGAQRLSGVDAYIFLNPDVHLAGPSISELWSQMARQPAVGVATGPVVDPQGRRVPSAWGPTSAIRAFWFASGWHMSRTRGLLGQLVGKGATTSGASTVRTEMRIGGHVLGGAMMARRECFEELGGFDEDFFLYWEDADLCERARRAGWKIALLSCTPFVHEQGTSSKGIDDEQRWRWYVEGAERFAGKHLAIGEQRRLMAALHLGRKLRRYR